ncbi:MAG: hypothetical protein JW727_07000 [Candidatus Aenigmarchaeota archaeon]|nr:hypothetical protein [Candidatus Aenigmarchaeota archaeon]
MNSELRKKDCAACAGKFARITLSLLLIASAASLLAIPAIAAENVSDTINITVQVGSKTIVVIDPDTLSWTGAQAVDPGREGVSKEIQIENMGSTNITHLWANTTYETAPPFGTGVAANYNAGNFVALSKTNGTSDYYYFVNRVEYNETHPDIYLTLPASWEGYGRFRDGGKEYFWAVVPNTNCTDGTFYIGKEPHNETQSGTVDISACDATLNDSSGGQACRSGTLTPNAEGTWGYALQVYVGSNAEYHNYSVSVNADCNTTMFSHWNKDAPGGTAAGSHIDYLSSTTLYPGAAAIMYAKVKVAYGTAAGNIAQGQLTIIAESA